jgi:hypothetical protein
VPRVLGVRVPPACALAEPIGALASRFDAREVVAWVSSSSSGSAPRAGVGVLATVAATPATADRLTVPAGAGVPHTSQ